VWEATEKIKLKHRINSDRFNRQMLIAIFGKTEGFCIARRRRRAAV
jgi:hypothetical protein